MTLTQLEYFCAVCRYHSITRAAEILFVGQPAISMSIKKLEEEFHIRLFEHGGNRIKLTHEGEAFYFMAESLLSRSQDMYTTFSEMGSRQRPIRIGIPPMISTIFFPKLINEFHNGHTLPVRLFEYGSVRACELVRSGDLDLAIVNMDYYDIGSFNSHVMMTDSYSFCVSRKHRLAAEETVDFNILSEEPVLMFNTDSVQNKTISSCFQALGIRPNILMHSSQLFTILNFVREGNCGAFLFSSMDIDKDEFKMLPLRPEIKNDFGLVWKKDVTPPLGTRRFIEFVKKTAS